MDELLNHIEAVKEKLSSEEYKNLLTSLQVVHKELDYVTFEIFIPSVFYTIECFDVYIKPQIRRIVLSQPSFQGVMHVTEGEFFKIPFDSMMEALTPDNAGIIKSILYEDSKDPVYIEHATTDVLYDPKDFFYVRFLKGSMDEI